MIEDGQSPDLATLIWSIVQSFLKELNTASPGTVVAYDVEKEEVDVRVELPRTYRDENGEKVLEPHGVVYSVPVCWPRAGSNVITFPISEGDRVLLVFCQRNIGQWQVEGKLSDPGDEADHPLSGAVAIPGMYPEGEVSGQADNDATVIAYDQGRLGSKDASEAQVLGDQLKAWLEAVTFPTSFGPTGTAIPPFPLSQALSTKTKVE